MSARDYISVPKELKTLSTIVPFSDFDSGKKESGLFHGIYEECERQLDGYVYYPSSLRTSECCATAGEGFGVSFQDKGIAILTDCFKNPFVYKLHKGRLPGYMERQKEMLIGQNWNELEALNDELCSFMRQMLYESLDLILDIGEFAELCTIFIDHVNYDFGPPTSERIIKLSDLLTISDILYAPDNAPVDYIHKITIHKI